MNNLKSNVPFSFKTSKRVNELSNEGTFALNVERPLNCKMQKNAKLCYCTQVEPCMTLILTEIKEIKDIIMLLVVGVTLTYSRPNYIVHTVWILINFVTHILWVPNGTKHNVTYLPLSPFHIFTDLSNAALAIRRPSGEKLTWFIKAWWPVIRAKGFLLSSGSHRKRVKSSEPDTNRSPLPPCTKLNKNRLSWWSTIKLFAL